MRPEPTLEADARTDFEEYNIFAAPTAMLLLYAVTGALSLLVCAAALRSIDSLDRDSYFILGAVLVAEVAATAGLRAVIGDMLRDMSLRERAGLVLIHFIALLLPPLLFSPAYFVESLIALLLSLHLFLVERQHFVRVLGLQLLILFVSQLTGVEDDAWAFATVAGALALFALAAHLLHTSMLMERYERSFPISIGWLGGALGPTLLAVGGMAGAVAWMIPPRDFNARPTLRFDLNFAPGATPRAGGNGLGLGENFFYALGIAAMALLLLWIVAQIRDRLAQGRAKDLDLGLGIEIEEDLPEGSTSSRRAPAPRDARQSVIAAYLDFCRVVGDFAGERSRHETAAEYETRLRDHDWLAPEAGELAGITRAFESARYGTGAITAADATAFRERTRGAAERARRLKPSPPPS